VVRDSEPPVPEDQGQREQNRLFTEGYKWKKDTAKKKRNEDVCAREALEKRRRQQARDGLPLEESPLEPESGGDGFKSSSDEAMEAQGLGSKMPSPGAPVGGPRSTGRSVLPGERSGGSPLGPSEMLVSLTL
jgi:hypothetical protein